MNAIKKFEHNASTPITVKKAAVQKSKKQPSALRLVKKVVLPKRGEFNFLKSGRG
jgi:hypothetical protein